MSSKPEHQLNIFVSIVCYNGEDYIEGCLKSVFSSSIPVHVIVVDNNSQDKTNEIIQEKFPQVELIKSKYNLGFGKANNLIFTRFLEEEGDYIILLNQDAEFIENSLKTLINKIKSNSNFDLLSPIHLNSTFEIDRYFKAHTDIQKFVREDKIKSVQFVNAACWVLSRDCLLRVGGFDPIFTHYGEDNNFIMRLNYLDRKVGVYLNSIVLHHRNQTKFDLNALSNARIKFLLLNIILDLYNPMFKNYFVSLKFFVGGVINKQITYRNAFRYLKVYIELLFNLSTLQKKRSIYKNTKTPFLS